jgi:hypothetical protein
LLDPNGDSFSALPNWSYSNALVQQFQGLQQQQGGPLSTGGLAVVQFPMLVIRLLKKWATASGLKPRNEMCEFQSNNIWNAASFSRVE